MNTLWLRSNLGFEPLNLWTFWTANVQRQTDCVDSSSENSWLTILRRLTLFLRTLTSGSGKNLNACNCINPNLDWCTIQTDSSKGLFNYAIMHLLFWIVSKLFKIHIIYNIIYILYYILIYHLRELNHFIRPNA